MPDLVRQGLIDVAVDSSYRMSDFNDALRRFGDRRKTGKVVIDVV